VSALCPLGAGPLKGVAAGAESVGSRSGQTRREAGTQSQGSHVDRPAADLK